MKRLMTAVMLFAGALAVHAGGQAEDNGPLKVVATTSLVTDVVSQIGRDKIDLYGLMGPGKDPHTYEPAPRDMAVVEEADLIFSNGFDLEEGLVRTLDSVKTGLVVEVSRGIEVLGFEEADDHDEEAHHAEDDSHDQPDHQVDPHTWTSPLNVLVWVENISAALEEADPENRDFYRENAAFYRAELVRLDDEIRSALSAIPREDRILVSDHKALNYFARDYGFEAAGAIIPSFSTNSETSARQFAALVHLIEERKVKALFIGSTSGDAVKKMGEAVQTELGYPLPVIPLLSGSLMPKGQEGDDYLGYIRYNAGQILKGLGR